MNLVDFERFITSRGDLCLCLDIFSCMSFSNIWQFISLLQTVESLSTFETYLNQAIEVIFFQVPILAP